MSSVYPSWNEESLAIPPRSRLYQLNPVGIGTTYVESLTSFTNRLAEAHCLLPGILMTREIAIVFDQEYLKNGAQKGLPELFNRSSVLNGTGSLSGALVNALQKLTLIKNLHLLTLQKYVEIFSTKGLLRQTKAWCPHCYEQEKTERQVIYDPLLWTLQDFRICHQHHQVLQTLCPHCGKSMPFLSWNSRPGFCSRCQGWLGGLPKNTCENPGRVIEEQEKIWESYTLGELMAKTSEFEIPKKLDVTRAIQLIISTVYQDNIAAFARVLKIPRNTAWTWYTGKNIPPLSILLKIAYLFKISLLDLLNLDQNRLLNSEMVLCNSVKTKVRHQRCSPKTLDLQWIEQKLKEVLFNQPVPPPTMQSLAIQLNVDLRTVFHHFPDLCKAVTAQYRNYQKQKKKQEIALCCEEVKEVVCQLVEEGQYPSEKHVSAFLSKPGYFRYQEVRVALEQARASVASVQKKRLIRN